MPECIRGCLQEEVRLKPKPHVPLKQFLNDCKKLRNPGRAPSVDSRHAEHGSDQVLAKLGCSRGEIPYLEVHG